ncbi:MAG: NAD(P)H-hydrate dehydratase [bacterium]|nr:NAD(P)H-hydrate dehydratase [bacterium]
MKVVTKLQMQEIDKKASAEFNIPSIILMENAGLVSSLILKEEFSGVNKITIFAGGGNNGGDGLVIARHLFNQGIAVTVYLLKEADEIKGDALTNLNITRALGVPIKEIPNVEELKKERSNILEADIILDAILGTGTSGEIEGFLANVINFLNDTHKPIIAIDIPSGLDADTGFPLGCCIRAKATFTLGLPKIGLLLYPGAEFAGEISLVDISLPKQLVEDEQIKVNLLLKEDVLPLLPRRAEDAHKGSCGRVVTIAGSVGMTGAAVMTAQSCLAMGAGLSILGTPKSLNPIVAAKVTEVITKPLSETPEQTVGLNSYDEIMELVKDADCVAIGPGLGRNNEVVNLVRKLIPKVNIPMVIDADGLFALAGNLHILKEKTSPVIITPHPGEMAMLLGITTDEVQKDRLGTAQRFAQKYQLVVILKGARTIIADPEGNTFINSTGNSGMATAGCGDVLTGMLAGLLAQDVSVLDAAKLGVFLHGLSGDLVLEEKGKYSLVASDLIAKIPAAIKGNEK